jgi:hypothetical protein
LSAFEVAAFEPQAFAAGCEQRIKMQSGRPVIRELDNGRLEQRHGRCQRHVATAEKRDLHAFGEIHGRLFHATSAGNVHWQHSFGLQLVLRRPPGVVQQRFAEHAVREVIHELLELNRIAGE